jgi:hypothetical protein
MSDHPKYLSARQKAHPLTLAVLMAISAPAALAQTKGAPPQVVKPPIALAYIDLATASTDIPGAAMFGGALRGAQTGGAQSGGAFGALGGLLKGATGAAGVGNAGGGNVFGNTQSMGMGFGSGRYMDVSVYTTKNRALAEATQTIPAGMILGESLKLVAPVPDKPVPAEPVREEPVPPTYEQPKGKISLYWGCGDTIRPGQPRTIDFANMKFEDLQKVFIARGVTTRGARSLPGHPAWPNKQDDRMLPDSASLVGQHTFTGQGLPESFKVSLGAQHDIMPAIQMTQQKTDGSVKLEWTPVTNARGYFISAIGGKSDGDDSGEAIFWSSSELADTGFGLMDYQSNANIDKWIGEKVILPASATKCTVPKGIFPEGAGGMLRMIAYGSEAFLAYPPRPTDPKMAWEPEWQTKVRMKSTFGSVLGGVSDRSGPPRSSREEPKAKEEKKPNPVDLLKGLFGR